MAKTKKKTLEFKKTQCQFCALANKAKIRQGRSDFCDYKNNTGKDPDIRNGHCEPFKPTGRKKREKSPTIHNDRPRETETTEDNT